MIVRNPVVFVLLFLALAGCNTPKPPPAASPKPPSVIQFRDVTASAGIAVTRTNGGFGKKWMPETLGGGGAFLDYNQDGRLDVLIVTGAYLAGYSPSRAKQPTLALYRNEGDGHFTDVTRQAGLAIATFGMGAAVGDYDNDGYDDLFLTAVGGSRLFHNAPDGQGGRKFVEVTEASRIRDTGFATSAAWVDYDRDGRLDLFVCHYVKWSPETDVFCGTTVKEYCRPTVYSGESCRLYHNEDGKRFTDVTKQVGLYNPDSKGLGVCIVDLDEDGFPDIVVANDMEANSVYHNQGGRTFKEIGLASGIAVSDTGQTRAGMGIDAADARNDGKEYLAIGNFAFEGIAFYEPTGEMVFTERAKQAGLFTPSYPFVTFGLLFADFDNDSWSDLFVTNGHIQDTHIGTNPEQAFAQHALLFRNQGEGSFTDMTQSAGEGVSLPMVGRGACRGDFDDDGKMDLLLIPNVGAPRLLHNETPASGHWLSIRLRGTRGNRNGFGAKVTVEAGGKRYTSYARSGSSYLAGNDTRLHFGLGASAQIERISVRWTNGKVETWKAQAADRVITLTEGQGAGKT